MRGRRLHPVGMAVPRIAGLAADGVWRGIHRGLRGRPLGRGQWYLLHGFEPLEAVKAPDPSRLSPLFPPVDRFWADPFLWSQGGEVYAFVEEWVFGEPHAHISVLRLDEGPAPMPRTVISEPHHLSYPFLFEHGGSLYMVPESSAARAVRLYRCESFPDRWVQVHDLLVDVDAVDPTLFQHRGRWWLFVAMRDGTGRGHHSLHAFSADSPLSSSWLPHPLNPIVRGHRNARPAGRVLRCGDRLFRPAQESSLRYGYALRIQEILELTQSSYVERRTNRLPPSWMKGNLANHHLDWHAGILVMDAQRVLPPEPDR
jgi:hypothetical protein